MCIRNWKRKYLNEVRNARVDRSARSAKFGTSQPPNFINLPTPQPISDGYPKLNEKSVTNKQLLA